MQILQHNNMKYILIFSILFLEMAACQNTGESAAASKEGIKTDSLAIADALHGFFKWYEDNNERLGTIRFVDNTGVHLKLDEAKLDEYLAEFEKSGFVSNGFIEDEKKFYRTCSAFWATEPIDEVPTGLGADRYYCAQDFVAPYSTGAGTSMVQGDRADAVLALDETSKFNFGMVRKNGRWLLDKTGCNMGVQYE
jgi:hypothetical protein